MINGYDFDETIYDGDSSVDFYFFCLRKNKKVLKQIPEQIKSLIKYKTKKIEKTEFKESVFSFLKHIDNSGIKIIKRSKHGILINKKKQM